MGPCPDSVTDIGRGRLADSVGALVPTRARARVHSVFARACNLETDCGEMVTLLASGCGSHPRGIRYASRDDLLPLRLRPGQAAVLQDMALRIPATDVVVNFSRAAVWKGTVAASSPAWHQLRDLFELVRSHAPTQGFAPALFASGNSRSPFQRAMIARIAQTLPKLARATETRDARTVVAALRSLVGLGDGLTPAGDDFIVGYLAALSSRAYHERGLAALLRALAVPVAQLSRHTHAISRQMLLDALEGHFAERLTEVVRCLGGREVAGAASRLMAVGHTSGADMLCGLLFGFAPVLTAKLLVGGASGNVVGETAHAPVLAC